MSFSEIQLLARVLGTPFALFVCKVTGHPGQYAIYQLLAPMQPLGLVGYVAIPGAHPHFPYGVPCLPD